MDIKQKALEQAVKILNASKAKYWIQLPDGTELGERPSNKKEKPLGKREAMYSVTGYKFGTLTQYVIPYVQNMQPGDVVEIPCGPHKLERIRSCVTGYIAKHWGNGNYTTEKNATQNVVAVMRYA